MKKLPAIIILLLSTAIAAAADTETQTFKRDVTAFIEGKLKQTGVTGLSFAFVDTGTGTGAGAAENLVWTDGFGYADAKNKTKATDKTIFKIASISKTFTMMALMQLCEAGKASMSDPVTKYVPNFTIKPHPARGGRAADITLDMLAKHRSGIPGDNLPGGRTPGGFDKNFLNNLPDILRNMTLTDAPPSKFQAYSNAGVTLLGYIVAAIAEPGMDRFDGFVKYTQENLFDKMGMDMTSFIMKDNMRPWLSKGYDKDGAEIPQTLYINGLPAGSARSNAQDMAKYIQALLARGKNVLKPESLGAMLLPEDTYHSIDYTGNIGRVWMSQYPFGREYPVRAHNGASPPFYSVIMIMPAQNLGVFVSINSNGGRGLPADIAKYALEKALASKLGKSVTAAAAAKRSATASPPAPQKLPKTELAKYTGFYVDTESSREIVMGKDDRLYLRLPGPNMKTKDLALTHHGDGTFVADTGRRLAFAGAGKDMVMYDIVNGEKRTPAIRTNKPAVPPYFDSWRGMWRLQSAQENQNAATTSATDAATDATTDDDEGGAAGGPPMLVFGEREGVPYCMLRPVRFVDKGTCYLEIHGRAGGMVIRKTPDGNLATSTGAIYKRPQR